MAIYNAGEDIINAYLAGTRTKEAREARIASNLARLEANKIRQQQVDDAWAKFKEEHALNKTNIDSQIAARDSQNKLRSVQEKAQSARLALSAFQAINRGDLSGLPPEVVQETLKQVFPSMEGFYDKLKIPTDEEIAQREANLAGTKAGAVAGAQMPYIRERMLLGGEIGQQKLLKQQEFQGHENELNRQNAREVARIRAQQVLSSKAATANEKQEAKQELADAILPDIYTGQMTLNDPALRGQAGLHIITEAKKQGYRIFREKERDKLNEAPDLARFLDKISDLNKALKNYNVSEARNLSNSIQADLGLFARNTKAEKGNMSNQDIARMAELLPGWTYTNEQNEKRVKEIENIYFDRMEQMFRGMNPVQRKAVKERWEIRERPSKTIKNKSGDEIERLN